MHVYAIYVCSFVVARERVDRVRYSSYSEHTSRTHAQRPRDLPGHSTGIVVHHTRTHIRMASGEDVVPEACADATQPVSLSVFIDRSRQLLALEHTAEREEAARYLEGLTHRERERRGVALCRLRVSESHTALNGRTILRFVSSRRPGDVAGTSSANAVAANASGTGWHTAKT